MKTSTERKHFLEQGYVHVSGVIDNEYLESLQSWFDYVWEREEPRVSQHQLLQYQPFIDLIQHPPILERHRAVFGSQVQLLEYDLLRQGPMSESAERSWHRDFSFPGGRPLAINTIIYLDEMTDERGPTRLVPGTHRGEEGPPKDLSDKPLPGEVSINAAPGDAVFINSAVWHTGGRNRSNGVRRNIFLYFGYWWMKRYKWYRALPWQALVDADEERLQLLGVKMPGMDLHMYEVEPPLEDDPS